MAGKKEFELLFKLTASLSKGYAAQFKQASAAMKSLTNSTKGVQQAQQKVSIYQKTTATLAKQRKHLENLQATQRSLQREYGETEKPSEALRKKMQQNEQQIARTTGKIKEQETSLSQLQQELKQAGINTDDLTAEAGKLAAAYDKVKASQQQLQNISRMQQANSQAISQTKTQIVGTAATAAATAAVLYNKTIKPAAEFEQQMSAVGAISNATAEDIKLMSTAAKNAGATTKFTAAEAGKAMEYMAMAGWKTQQMISGLPGILNAAAASGEDLAIASDIITDALTAMGYSAQYSGQMADVLAAASSNSNTNIALMGETFKYVGTLVGAMKYSMEDAALATGLMANSGIKGSMAGTALAAVISRLSTDTNGARAAIQALGVEFYNADGSARPLKKVMDELRAATQGMTTAEQAELAKTVAGEEAKKGFLAIINATTEDYNKLSDAIYNSAGAAEKMANMRLDNYAGEVTVLKSAMEALQIAIGEALLPTLKAIIAVITPMIQNAAIFINNNPELIRSIAGITAGLVGFKMAGLAAKLVTLELHGGILAVAKGMTIARREAAAGAVGMGLFGKALRPLSGLLAPLAATKGFQGIAKLAGLLGPFAPFAIVLTGIVAGTQLLSGNLESISKTIETIFGSGGVAVLTQLVSAMTAAKTALHGFLYGDVSGSTIHKVVQLVGTDGWTAFVAMRTAIQSATQSFGQLFATIGTYVTPILSQLLIFVTGTLMPGIFEAIIAYAPMIANIVSGLCSGIGMAIKAIGTVTNAVLPVVLTVFNATFGAIKMVVGSAIEVINGAVNAIKSVKNAVTGVWNSVKNNKTVTAAGAQAAAISVRGYAKGTTSTPNTFIAGENGPELITNAPGRTVYTAQQTRAMFNMMRARNQQADLPKIGGRSGSIYYIQNAPQIDARGMSKEELEEVLERNNRDLERRIDRKKERGRTKRKEAEIRMTEYRTIQGDTWDMIAYKVWGDCMLTAKLMAANESEIETVIFSAGTILTIPEVSAVEAMSLPPWKR